MARQTCCNVAYDAEEEGEEAFPSFGQPTRLIGCGNTGLEAYGNIQTPCNKNQSGQCQHTPSPTHLLHDIGRPLFFTFGSDVDTCLLQSYVLHVSRQAAAAAPGQPSLASPTGTASIAAQELSCVRLFAQPDSSLYAPPGSLVQHRGLGLMLARRQCSV